MTRRHYYSLGEADPAVRFALGAGGRQEAEPEVAPSRLGCRAEVVWTRTEEGLNSNLTNLREFTQKSVKRRHKVVQGRYLMM